MKMIAVPLVLLMIISINCNPTKDQDIKTIHLENKDFNLKFVKEKETKVEEIGNVILQDIASDKHILIKLELSETTDFRFFKYDHDLNLINRMVIPYGEGPLECALPFILGGDDSNLIVFDVRFMRYYLYDTNMKSRQELKAKKRGWLPQGVNYSAKYKTVAKCKESLRENEDIKDFILFLEKLNPNMGLDEKIIYKYSRKYTFNPNMCVMETPVHYSMTNDFIYVLIKKDYRILKIDLSGKVIKEIKIEGLEDVYFSKEERGQWIENLGFSWYGKNRFTFPEKLYHANWIIGLADGIAVGRIKDYNVDNHSEFGEADYYDLDLNYRGKIKIPWFFGWNEPSINFRDFSLISKNDILFLIDRRETQDDEEYWITRWRIVK